MNQSPPTYSSFITKFRKFNKLDAEHFEYLFMIIIHTNVSSLHCLHSLLRQQKNLIIRQWKKITSSRFKDMPEFLYRLKKIIEFRYCQHKTSQSLQNFAKRVVKPFLGQNFRQKNSEVHQLTATIQSFLDYAKQQLNQIPTNFSVKTYESQSISNLNSRSMSILLTSTSSYEEFSKRKTAPKTKIILERNNRQQRQILNCSYKAYKRLQETIYHIRNNYEPTIKHNVHWNLIRDQILKLMIRVTDGDEFEEICILAKMIQDESPENLTKLCSKQFHLEALQRFLLLLRKSHPDYDLSSQSPQTTDISLQEFIQNKQNHGEFEIQHRCINCLPYVFQGVPLNRVLFHNKCIEVFQKSTSLEEKFGKRPGKQPFQELVVGMLNSRCGGTIMLDCQNVPSSLCFKPEGRVLSLQMQDRLRKRIQDFIAPNIIERKDLHLIDVEYVPVKKYPFKHWSSLNKPLTPVTPNTYVTRVVIKSSPNKPINKLTNSDLLNKNGQNSEFDKDEASSLFKNSLLTNKKLDSKGIYESFKENIQKSHTVTYQSKRHFPFEKIKNFQGYKIGQDPQIHICRCSKTISELSESRNIQNFNINNLKSYRFWAILSILPQKVKNLQFQLKKKFGQSKCFIYSIPDAYKQGQRQFHVAVYDHENIGEWLGQNQKNLGYQWEQSVSSKILIGSFWQNEDLRKIKEDFQLLTEYNVIEGDNYLSIKGQNQKSRAIIQLYLLLKKKFMEPQFTSG